MRVRHGSLIAGAFASVFGLAGGMGEAGAQTWNCFTQCSNSSGAGPIECDTGCEPGGAPFYNFTCSGVNGSTGGSCEYNNGSGQGPIQIGTKSVLSCYSDRACSTLVK
jgi:hypothetical protein